MRRKLDSASEGAARRKRPAWLPCLAATALLCAGSLAAALPDRAKAATGSRSDDVHWIGTWANPFCDTGFRCVTDVGNHTVYFVVVTILFWVGDRKRASVLFLLVTLLDRSLRVSTAGADHTRRTEPGKIESND